VLLAEPFVVRLEGRGSQPIPAAGHGRDRNTGRPDHAAERYEKFAAHPAVAGDVLAVGMVSSGKPLWEWQGKGTPDATVLSHLGRLMVLHGYGDRLSVLDPADGRVVAHRRLPGYAFEPRFAVSGDVIAVSCASGGGTRRLRAFRWR
jgi:hypothetical protein